MSRKTAQAALLILDMIATSLCNSSTEAVVLWLPGRKWLRSVWPANYLA